MAKTKNTILHRWFEEVWNKGRAELIEGIVTPDAVAHGLVVPNGNPVRGTTEFAKFFQGFRSAFLDPHVKVRQRNWG